MTTGNGKRKFGLFVAGSAEVTFRLERIGGKTKGDRTEGEHEGGQSGPSNAKVPTQTWRGDYMKHVDRDKVEIWGRDEGSPATGRLVAVVCLDKGQNVSEITD